MFFRAACFLGALQLVGARAGKKEIVDKAKVHATVFLGHPTDPNLEGFGLRVELTIEGCEDDALIQPLTKYDSLFSVVLDMRPNISRSSAHIAVL